MLLLAGCGPGEREARPFTGRWESLGFGLYLDIHGGDVDIYEHTAVHCYPVAAGSARGISDVFSLEGERLVLRDGGRVVEFEAIATVPERCVAPLDASLSSVFGITIASVAEHLLPAPSAAWLAEAAAIGSALAAGATPAETHAALVAALSLLSDPEIRLAAGNGAVPPSWPPPPDLAAGLTLAWESAWGGRALVGEAAPGVAYVGFLRLVAEGADDQRALAAALDGALAGADAAVIDLRAASGGVEEAALQVATRFVPTERVVATLLARQGDGVVAAGGLSVTPRATGTFAGLVVVLVGPATSGAGELLARVLAELPGVTVVGEPSSGSPREPLVRALPNGWSVGIPNLQVIGPDGSEWVGTPLIPDVIAATTIADLTAGRDPGLEAARAEVAKSAIRNSQFAIRRRIVGPTLRRAMGERRNRAGAFG